MNEPITCDLCGRLIDHTNDCELDPGLAICRYCWEGLFSGTKNRSKPQRRRPRSTPRSVTKWDDD